MHLLPFQLFSLAGEETGRGEAFLVPNVTENIMFQYQDNIEIESLQKRFNKDLRDKLQSLWTKDFQTIFVVSNSIVVDVTGRDGFKLKVTAKGCECNFLNQIGVDNPVQQSLQLLEFNMTKKYKNLPTQLQEFSSYIGFNQVKMVIFILQIALLRVVIVIRPKSANRPRLANLPMTQVSYLTPVGHLTPVG